MKTTESLNILFISLLILIIAQTIQSQNNPDENIQPGKAEIILIARADKDSVVLRWAPSTAGGWIIANKIGYNIERVKVNSENANAPVNFEKLNSEPVKPLSIEEWKKIASKDNIFSAIAVQAIYGKLFTPKALDENNLNALKNAADELMNRYSFALFAADNDAVTAQAMGLRWVDKNVREGESYAYRVYVAQKTDEYSFDTAFVFADIKPADKVPAPMDLTFESGDGNITLKWKDNPLVKFSGYYVYRSEDGKNFIKMNEMPLVIATPKEAKEDAQPSFVDTLTVNYKNYSYKVYGVTPFGELSQSAEITAYSKDLTAPFPPILEKPKQFTADKISLSWKVEEETDDLKGFVVARSNHPLYNFEILTPTPLAKNVFSYTDKIPQENEIYYAVASVDTAGNMAFSLPQIVIPIDTMPPSIPKGISGTIDSNGVVTLKWNLGPEWNLLGYRILRANDPQHEFQQLTGEIYQDTVFVDTVNINTLTNYVYYRIAAVNMRYQHSELSPVISIKRPDKIPPVEAVFKNVFVTDTSVFIEWVPSTSADLAYQKLLRRKQGDSDWKMIDSLSANVSSYTDTKVEKTITYEYTIISVDSSGLKSPFAFPVFGRPYDTGRRESVAKLTAKYDDNTSSVILNWDYLNPPNEKYWFVIYRGTDNNKLMELKSVDGANKSYSDKEIVKGKKYFYAVSVMTSMGGVSDKVVTAVTIPEK
ncbi:Hypothetical protein IALB_3157 [Ignavibacterium album JCM 16511]|uniref:Fibronectin type-III domain-containing protein n=1 Tax=Ignavibacterium album (strain DSM 19864 / JCM 16511 / NBRC 101810 / Mat9-16) TaxID=945713 RepID=I0APF3_IGNAJ|nr:hypothetical protein [Ignavibacterium album]AFH50860.1 Hypothetical protein IALB_3157 [Ignavibacterium album JCM 16511]